MRLKVQEGRLITIVEIGKGEVEMPELNRYMKNNDKDEGKV